MGRRPKGSWPGTPEEKQDRVRVVRLVNRVGEGRLTFTTRDLRAEIERTQSTPLDLSLNISGELWRHLYAMEGDLIVEVGRRDFGDEEAKAGSRTRKKWCLKRRLADLETADGGTVEVLDDLERAHFALWVAIKAAGVEEVHTNAVTQVLRNITPLSLTKDRQTHGLLQPLAERSVPVVEKVKKKGERWCRWKPVGDQPEHPDFDEWVARFRQLDADTVDLTRSGQATVTEAARKLVRLAIRGKASTTYRRGQCVALSDLRKFAGENDDGKKLAARIRRSRSIAEAVVDASREVLSGEQRVDVRIARITAPLSREVYYDVPEEPGFEQRSLIVILKDLRKALNHDRVLDLLDRDVQGAQTLATVYPQAEAELEAAVATRTVLAQREFEFLEDLLSRVAQNRSGFTKVIREEIDQHQRALNGFLAGGIGAGDEAERLVELSGQIGLDRDVVLGADRPLVHADQYMDWYPEEYHGNYTPAEFMWLAMPVRRFSNPDYTHRRDPDLNRRYPVMADRVEALTYAADKLFVDSGTLLSGGARLLGRNLRSAHLVRALGQSEDYGLQRDALSALVLLGDREGVLDLAAKLLATPSTPPIVVEAAIRLLHLVEGPHPKHLPDHVKRNRDPAVQAALRDVMIARHNGRRLV